MLKLCSYALIFGFVLSAVQLASHLFSRLLHASVNGRRWLLQIIIGAGAATLFSVICFFFFDEIAYRLFREVQPTGLQLALIFACASVPTALMLFIGWRTGLFKTEPKPEEGEEGIRFVEINSSRVSLDNPDEMRRNMDKL